MALTHYIGGKLTGLTVDFPPSLNYPNLTTFINTETFQEFILVSGVWEPIGPGGSGTTLQFDFDDNEGFIDDPPQITVDLGNSWWLTERINDGSAIATGFSTVGALSDTAWTMKFSMLIFQEGFTVSGNAFLTLGISDNTSDFNTSNDLLAFQMAINRTAAGTPVSISSISCNNAAPAAATSFSATIVDVADLPQSTELQRFGKIRRTSATNLRVEFFTDDQFSIPWGDANVDLAVSASITGLKFLKAVNQSGTNGNVARIKFQQIQIFDGVPDA